MAGGRVGVHYLIIIGSDCCCQAGNVNSLLLGLAQTATGSQMLGCGMLVTDAQMTVHQWGRVCGRTLVHNHVFDRFQDTARFWSKSAKFSYHLCTEQPN